MAILFATLVGIPMGVTRLPGSFIDMPHSLTPVLGQIDMLGALNIAFLPFLFVFFASEFFSTMGTTLAVGGEAGLLDEEGNIRISIARLWLTRSPRPLAPGWAFRRRPR
ncbi:xanthine/uracil/thiamine/ascorbate permease family protein [Klebsiella michiganensis]|nr:xanthine/uracil/thiamine/ascorbate permease family protein [Klebsiella michiganensis]